ncbi:sodium/hydrogen antiporter, partial [Phenoliferia sp. Uapishka_3]
MAAIASSPDHLPPFVVTDISSISLALLVLGGYVCLVGQLSYFVKERLFISSALISISLGIAAGPIGLNWISPWIWTDYSDEARNELTFQLCRIVIGIQVMFAGISLPAAYLKREWKSILVLLLPIMTIAWFVSAGLILAFIPGLTFVEALCISACVTPTDPILANAIVKGRYAEKHVPHAVRNIISAESGANDGLGYPFIFLPIFLMKRGDGSISAVMREWVVTTWIYQIILACVMGALIGYVARKTLKIAHKHNLIDHESFLSYGIGLAFFTLGVVGIIGSDDVLCCFVAGNSLTWRDFYRIESEDDTFQDVIDSLLNAAIFIYLGALLPWSEFGTGPLTGWRLFLLGLCILAIRRLPWIMLLYPITPALANPMEALFAGWFGPIGVSAVYYAILALKELPEDRVLLRQVILPVVLFIALTSTVAHPTTIQGVTIPLTKFAPKALTHTRSFASYTSNNAGALAQRMRNTSVRPSDISSPLRARLARQKAGTDTADATPTLSRASSFNARPGDEAASHSREESTNSTTSMEMEPESFTDRMNRIEEGQQQRSKTSTPPTAVLTGVEEGRPAAEDSILVVDGRAPTGKVQFSP